MVEDALEMQVFYDRGLILISEQANILDATKDKAMIDELIGFFNKPIANTTNTNLVLKDLGEIRRLSDVVWNGDKFVAVGGWGTIMWSKDGHAWNQVQLSDEPHLYSIAWNGKRFVAVGAYNILTSADGISWKKEGDLGILYDVIWNGNKFMAVGSDGVIVSSPDGSVWTKETSGTEDTLLSIAWNGKIFTATGWGNILTSVDGTKWQAIDFQGQHAIMDVTWANNLFVGVGNGNSIYTSKDGIEWTKQAGGEHIRDLLIKIVWDGKRFIALGGRDGLGGVIMVSEDGLNWTKQMISDDVSLDGFASNGKVSIVVGGDFPGYGFIYILQ